MVEALQEDLAWMAWTWQVGALLRPIAALLVVFTLLAVYRPETPRVGILRSRRRAATASSSRCSDRPSSTSSGSPSSAGWDLWWASALSLVYAVAVFRWV